MNGLKKLTFFYAAVSISVIHGQSGITGTIVGSGGEPVSGCIVSLTGDSVYATAGVNGTFALTPGGVSTIRRDADPFLTHKGQSLSFFTGNNAVAKFSLYNTKGKLLKVSHQTGLEAKRHTFNLFEIFLGSIPLGISFVRVESQFFSGDFRILNTGGRSSAFDVKVAANKTPLSKMAAAEDTLNIICSGYVPKQVTPVSFPADLGNITVNTPTFAKPNILLAMGDDWSYPHAGAYGADYINTPAFDRVAREGILFHNAYYPAPGCAPTRASVVTGRNIWENEQAGSHSTLFPEFLEEAYTDGRSVHVPGEMAPVELEVYRDFLEDQGYFMGYTEKDVRPFEHERPGNLLGQTYNTRTTTPYAPSMSQRDYAANFKDFLNDWDKNKPFMFWYGSREPHRGYKGGAGIDLGGKRLEDAHVPESFPDNNVVRSDILDYAYEVDYFDLHLGRMIKHLEDIGQLDNTVIIVTGDNGWPFPRGKATIYEAGIHAPLAIRWGNEIKGGRVVQDFINLAEFAPTFLELAGSPPSKTMTAKSFLPVLLSDRSGQVNPSRTSARFGRERHSNARPNNMGYPQRGIRTKDFLYIRNFKPDRWIMGDPPSSGPGCNYGDTDLGPTYKQLIGYVENGTNKKYTDWAFAKRPTEELFDMRNDPEGLINVAEQAEYASVKENLWKQLEAELIEGGDPRVLGYGDVWDAYPRYNWAKCETDWFVSGIYNPNFWSTAVEQAEAAGVVIKQNYKD